MSIYLRLMARATVNDITRIFLAVLSKIVSIFRLVVLRYAE